MAKIVFLTEEIVRASGIVRVVNMWANYLSKMQHEVRVVAKEIETPYYPFSDSVEIAYKNFDFTRKIMGIPFNTIQMYRYLKTFSKTQSVNLIIDRAVHIEPIWFFRKMGLFRHLNLIYFNHGGSSDFRDFYMNRLHTRHRPSMIFDAFDKVVCLYDDEKRYPKEIKEEKLYFIPNLFPFEPSEVEYVEKENMVLSLGRVTKAKGIDTLIKAWKEIEESYADWKLQIVGEGKDKEEFMALAEALNLKNIEFLPAINDVKSYYEHSKIFIIPSLSEGMPMTIIEAMACKSCVISSRTAGGNKLVKDKERGLLFSIGEEVELSEKTALLIDDTQLRESLSDNAFNYVKEYDMDNIYHKWTEVLV